MNEFLIPLPGTVQRGIPCQPRYSVCVSIVFRKNETYIGNVTITSKLKFSKNKTWKGLLTKILDSSVLEKFFFWQLCKKVSKKEGGKKLDEATKHAISLCVISKRHESYIFSCLYNFFVDENSIGTEKRCRQQIRRTSTPFPKNFPSKLSRPNNSGKTVENFLLCPKEEKKKTFHMKYHSLIR